MTTATAPAPVVTPDFAAIKQRQQATWASGDYHMIGTQILITAEQLFESLDVHSTERVLDVATGSGNAALAAARRGCDVIGIDYVPSLLERARERAVSEGVQARFEEGEMGIRLVGGERAGCNTEFEVVCPLGTVGEPRCITDPEL